MAISIDSGIDLDPAQGGASGPILPGDLPANIDASKIGAGGVGNTEFGFLDGVTSSIQAQLDEPLGATDITTAVQDLQTSASPQFAGINLGHASNTTLTQSAPGVLAIEGVDAVTVAATQTLTNKTLTAPKLANGGFVADANGNEGLILVTTASAVNEVTLTPAATGNAPKLAASGDDTNINLQLAGKGSGGVAPQGTGGTGHFLKQNTLNGVITSEVPSATDATKLPLTGGTVSGVLTFGGSNSVTGNAIGRNTFGHTEISSGDLVILTPTSQVYINKPFVLNGTHTALASSLSGEWTDANAYHVQSALGCLVECAKLTTRANSTAYSLCPAPAGDVLRCKLQDGSSKRAVALVDASGTVTFESGSHADYVSGSSPASGEVGVYVTASVLTIKPGSAGTRAIGAIIERARA